MYFNKDLISNNDTILLKLIIAVINNYVVNILVYTAEAGILTLIKEV